MFLEPVAGLVSSMESIWVTWELSSGARTSTSARAAPFRTDTAILWSTYPEIDKETWCRGLTSSMSRVALLLE